MNAPKDIQRFKNLLYLADLDEVVVVDIEKAIIIKHIKIDGARLLHNIAIDKNGIVYVSDLYAGKVHRIENGKSSVYLDSLGYAAGMLAIGSDLYILTAGNLVKADKNKKVITLSKGMDQRLNGIQMVNKNEFIITSWGGVVYYVYEDGSNKILLDTREKRIPAGMIYFNPEKRVLYMTSDQHNIVYAFRLK